jgi:DNA-directed RNA polymerase specialized sigma24 family protein
MADIESTDATMWLSIIGKSLASLCLSKAIEQDPEKYNDVLAKVKFLQGLGLSQNDAAEAAGSSVESVRVMVHMRKKAKNGKSKKKRGR